MSNTSLREHTILLTGATSGIGYCLAEQLAASGVPLVLHGRSESKLGRLLEKLRASGASVEPLVADLAKLDDVARMVKAAERLASPPTILINNAGVGSGGDPTLREESADGFELRFAVNYLAPYLLSLGLLARGALKAVVNVSSLGQEAPDLGDLQLERDYHGIAAYKRSKLALILATFDFAERHPATAHNVLHPGTFLDTQMVADAGIQALGPASIGADAISYVVEQSLAGLTGRYFNEQTEAKPNALAYDVSARLLLREKTEQLLAPWLAKVAR